MHLAGVPQTYLARNEKQLAALTAATRTEASAKARLLRPNAVKRHGAAPMVEDCAERKKTVLARPMDKLANLTPSSS
jgi:hypothetical protein